MDPFLKKHHHELREKISGFARKEIQPLVNELDEQEKFSPALTKRLGEMGLFGMQVPVDLGGQGLDTLAYIVAVEELAKTDSSQAATVASHNSLGIAPLLNHGTDEQKKKFIPKLCTGEHTWAFGLTEEKAGSDAMGAETKASLEDDQWVINGSKMFISNATAEISAGITLMVVTGQGNGKKELTTILVESDRQGYTREKLTGKLMWRATDTGKLKFENCKVPSSNLLGQTGQGGKIMLQTLDAGRLSIAAIGLGLAQGAFQKALSYARVREQFGQPIGKFQAISFKLADMDMKIELARNLLYKACWLKDNHQPFGKEAAMAKLYSSEIAREVADDALQIHGAHGLFKNNEVERFYRDQRLLQIGEGTSEILRLVISRKLGL
jgi:alkylation response protein AidB-like acyl-CoA dehydrogenase